MHELLKTMVSDKDVKLVSFLWQTLWHKMRTKLKFLTAFHPQTDEQTEVVNRTLRCLIGKILKTWNLILPMAKFAYNNFVNRTTCLSPFEIVTNFNPRQSTDLVPTSHLHSRISDSVSAFASHICALYEKIREKIMKNNVDYKTSVDLHRQLRTLMSEIM